MVLMAAVDNDHHGGAKFSPPASNPLAPTTRPPPASSSSSRTRLHDFSFPNLSWGTHRLLRCSKSGGPASSPPLPPSAPDKEKPHRPEGGGGGAGGSLQRRRRPAQRPWNLRTRRSATTAPARPAGSDDAAEEALPAEPRAPAPAAEAKRRGFSVALSKEEIAEDFAAIRGSRPPRRPKKRPRTVQRQLDLLYPGLCLADVTPGSYKIEER